MTAFRNAIFDELKDNLNKVQDQMKKIVDKGRREVQFDVGDYVFLTVSNHWPYDPMKNSSSHFLIWRELDWWHTSCL